MQPAGRAGTCLLLRQARLASSLLASTSGGLGRLERQGFAKQAKASAEPGEDRGSEARTSALLAALKPREYEKPKYTGEELDEFANRAKQFSRLKMQEHRRWQREMSTKLRLKIEAFHALPDDLKEAAAQQSTEPFPANRQMMFNTPPIPGYREQQHSSTRTRTGKTLGTK